MPRPTNDDLETIREWIADVNAYIVAANDYGVQLQFSREALRVRGDVKGAAQIVLAMGELYAKVKPLERQRDEALAVLREYEEAPEPAALIA